MTITITHDADELGRLIGRQIAEDIRKVQDSPREGDWDPARCVEWQVTDEAGETRTGGEVILTHLEAAIRA